ncbi:hypothetical protein GW17_00038038 [Ensete ventricosum]|nr:hypothetical protein GW17_00038038 [Ensete ventricosum]
MKNEKILKLLAEGEDLDVSLVSEVMTLHVLPSPHMDGKFSLHEAEMDDSWDPLHIQKQIYTPKPLLDFVGSSSDTKYYMVHPDGRLLFADSAAQMEDLLSIVTEFSLPKRTIVGTRIVVLCEQREGPGPIAYSNAPAVQSPRPPLASAGDPAALPTLLMEDVCEGKEFSFPQQEESILRFWSSIRAFETQLKRTELKPEYIFYDGPPFATGLPHYGHILAGTIKDVVTRYQSMSGHHVTRRFGWDCHGLPVEFEIDTKLGIRTRDDVLAMGIANYNEECRAIVTRYVKEWEEVITRTGRWIDFKNDYKTMDLKFMESVWWVFAQLWKKELVYRGFKVMPYSTGCKTPISNFEAGLNYKVSIPLVAWTTTPWTLPSNLALCVNADIVYVKVVSAEGGRKKNREKKKKREKKWEKKNLESGVALCSCDPSLVGDFFSPCGEKKRLLAYVPLFDYFMNYLETAFRVVSDSYVTDDSGTGVVHCAPAFGEDDYRVCVTSGIIKVRILEGFSGCSMLFPL